MEPEKKADAPEDAPGVVTVKLSKTIEHGGKRIESITLDFNPLTAEDYITAERRALADSAGRPVMEMRLNPGFATHIAAAACGLPVEVLRKLGCADFGRLTAEVRDFFLAG